MFRQLGKCITLFFFSLSVNAGNIENVKISHVVETIGTIPTNFGARRGFKFVIKADVHGLINGTKKWWIKAKFSNSLDKRSPHTALKSFIPTKRNISVESDYLDGITNNSFYIVTVEIGETFEMKKVIHKHEFTYFVSVKDHILKEHIVTDYSSLVIDEG